MLFSSFHFPQLKYIMNGCALPIIYVYNIFSMTIVGMSQIKPFH